METFTQVGALIAQVLNEYASNALGEPTPTVPGNALGAPHALAIPLRLRRPSWFPALVVMPGDAGGAVPSSVVVMLKSGGPIGTLKFSVWFGPPCNVTFIVKLAGDGQGKSAAMVKSSGGAVAADAKTARSGKVRAFGCVIVMPEVDVVSVEEICVAGTTP